MESVDRLLYSPLINGKKNSYTIRQISQLTYLVHSLSGGGHLSETDAATLMCDLYTLLSNNIHTAAASNPPKYTINRSTVTPAQLDVLVNMAMELNVRTEII